MSISTVEDRVRLIGEEIARLAELYRIAHAVYEAQPGSAYERNVTRWPRAENLIRARSPTFGGEALRYLEAIRPNPASVAQIGRYVTHWIGSRYSASACSQALADLARAGQAERAARRGSWQVAGIGQVAMAPRAPEALPPINAAGLREEVRRLILAYGPMETAELMRHVECFFVVGGRKPVDNFHTVVGKAKNIRYVKRVGFVTTDLLHLEPELRKGLRYRTGDGEPCDAP